ncbi:kynurenine formamidase isoform X7 [Zootermopsis nevadensis]|uniref:kynurenine formamidase isoform X7 n=1 Tax=Zootermopsis nevadensis TaxID=136037 RepID=UPI000B8E2485|nr:kynurenine formamidase isoform X7 [Zootermopsis nevadensis]
MAVLYVCFFFLLPSFELLCFVVAIIPVLCFQGTDSSVFTQLLVTAIPGPCSCDSKSHTTHHCSDAARKEVPVECGVKYGPKEGQILDLFGGKSLPHVKLSEIVEEIKEAAEYILNMAAKFGTRSLWFCGHSAGAQLVAMLLFSKWLDQLDDSVFRLLKGFVLISGVYDLTPLVSTYINNSLKLSSQEARSLSPLLLDITSPAVTKLRILVAVGDHDSPEFQRQSYEFAEKLRQHSQQVEYMTVAGVDHFDIVENLQQKDFILTKIIGVLMTG